MMNNNNAKQQRTKPRNGQRKGANSNLAPRFKQPLFPVAMRQTGTPKYRNGAQGSIFLTNREILVTLTGTAAAGVIPAGTAIKSFMFTPGTSSYILDDAYWLTKIARAYDKWRIIKLELSYQPSLAPGTTGGMLGYVFDSDPSRNTAIPSIPAMSGEMRSLIQHVVEPSTLKVLTSQLNRLPQYETFPIIGETTSVAQIGTCNVAWDPISLGASTIAGNLTIGRIFMDYEIEFLNPSNTVSNT